MKKQRGFGLLEVAIYAACIVAVCGAIYGVFLFVDAHWETSAGVAKGTNTTTALYAKRDNKALKDAIDAKAQLEIRVAVLEAEAEGKITGADADYQRGIQDGKGNVAAAVERVHAGYRLRDPGGTAGTPVQPVGQVPAPGDPGQRTGAATSGLPAATGCSLSEGKSEFLVRFAGEADDTARQLTACQVILVAMREFALKLSYTLGGSDGRPADQ